MYDGQIETIKMDEEKKRRYLELIENNINQHGFHVQYVLEEKDFTPFGYSTGLYKNFGIPEAFISGLPNGLTNTLITNYANCYKDQSIPFHKKLDHLIDRFQVYIIPVDTSLLEDKILGACRFYDGTDFDAVQIIYPDLNLLFPEEENYNYDMEIFGKIN